MLNGSGTRKTNNGNSGEGGVDTTNYSPVSSGVYNPDFFMLKQSASSLFCSSEHVLSLCFVCTRV